MFHRPRFVFLVGLVIASSAVLGLGCAKKGALPAATAFQTAAGGSAETKPTDEKIVVEAWATVRVRDLAGAAVSIRDRVQSLGGKIVTDRIQYASGEGKLTVRIPPEQTSAFLDGLAKLGVIEDRTIQAENVTKKVIDHEIQLANLTKSLQRHQEILAEAKTVEEILKVEAELRRLRGQIEEVKGTLAWLNDAVALATVHVDLRAQTPVLFAPNAKLHPGVRASSVFLFAEGSTPRRFTGGGASLHFARAFQLDLDVLQDSESSGVSLAMVTAGGDAYSDFLGRGERRWLNPYVGGRIGAARLDDRYKFILVGTLGTEIYKTDMVLLDLGVRLIGTTTGGDFALGVQPALSVHISF